MNKLLQPQFFQHAHANEDERLAKARQAFKQHHTQCFWSYDPNYTITLSDVSWVAKQLRKHGGRSSWETATQLCP